MNFANLAHDLISSLIYSILGILVFCLAFLAVDKLTPFHLWKELIEHKNQPLAIVLAALVLGICIIVASSIHG